VNLEQTHALLTFAASIDNRKFDDATVIGWQTILDDVDGADAMRAAVEHYRTTRNYLVPFDIRDGAQAIVDARERERFAAENAHRLRRIEVVRDEPAAIDVGPIRDRSPEVQALVAALAAKLPNDPDKLHTLGAYWRRQQRVARRDGAAS
jgi:hypothetical protein